MLMSFLLWKMLWSSKSRRQNFRCSHWSASLLETTYLFRLKKISKSVGIIAKARLYLSSQTLIALYYSLVYAFLTYCNVAWSSTYCSNLNCMYLLQKRLVRLIIKADYLANTAPLFNLLKVLDILVLIHFLSLLLCILITIIFCLVAFVTCS